MNYEITNEYLDTQLRLCEIELKIAKIDLIHKKLSELKTLYITYQVDFCKMNET
jgi:hypothetical protein